MASSNRFVIGYKPSEQLRVVVVTIIYSHNQVNLLFVFFFLVPATTLPSPSPSEFSMPFYHIKCICS